MRIYNDLPNWLGIDNKLRSSNGTNVSYFLADHLGSTNGLTDATGSLTATQSYDSFGNPTNPTFSSRYQFTGREFDPATGLQYSRARFYDPKIGRFISEDPIGFNGRDFNLYGYVWNSPTGYTDPLGLDGWTGNDWADWADGKINFARDWWKSDPQNWIWNGTVDTGADFAAGFGDMFRVGSGIGCAFYAEDENGYGRAAFVAMDVGRAAGLFATIAAPIAEPAAFGREYKVGPNGARVAPFGNRTGNKFGEWPHYHRRGPQIAPGRSADGQGIGRHRPWQPSNHDKTFWDRF